MDVNASKKQLDSVVWNNPKSTCCALTFLGRAHQTLYGLMWCTHCYHKQTSLPFTAIYSHLQKGPRLHGKGNTEPLLKNQTASHTLTSADVWQTNRRRNEPLPCDAASGHLRQASTNLVRHVAASLQAAPANQSLQISVQPRPQPTRQLRPGRCRLAAPH